ncbi:MAG: hypothetical protein KBI40_04890 [Firmicutes bacterium]|jgi:hypothetical protein|nr:hypothetical protein [Candidatus Fermentithermobacillaceae bacterium]
MAEQDPYTRKLVTTNYYADKSILSARVVAVLRGELENRNLELIPQPSRVVKQGEIHELIVTDEESSPGKKVQRIAYVAFVEFLSGGVLLSEDLVFAGNRLLGSIAGYDMAHFPNHMNIVINGERLSGEESGVTVGTPVFFTLKKNTDPNNGKPQQNKGGPV